VNTFNELWRKLRKSKKYREEFVASQLKRGIPFQIRTLMKQMELSQEELASRANLSQGVVSRAANPNYGNLTLNTIIRIAAGFDVAFIGRFVPFSELGRWFTDLSEESVRAKRFEEEDAAFAKLAADASLAAGHTISFADLVCRINLAGAMPALRRGKFGRIVNPDYEIGRFLGSSQRIADVVLPASLFGAMTSPVSVHQLSAGEDRAKLYIMPKRFAEQSIEAFNPPRTDRLKEGIWTNSRPQ